MLTPPNLMRLTDYQRSPAFVPTGQAHFVRTGSEFVCFVVSVGGSAFSASRLRVFPVFLYSVVYDFGAGRVQSSRFKVQRFKVPHKRKAEKLKS